VRTPRDLSTSGSSSSGAESEPRAARGIAVVRRAGVLERRANCALDRVSRHAVATSASGRPSWTSSRAMPRLLRACSQSASRDSSTAAGASTRTNCGAATRLLKNLRWCCRSWRQR
jgi:hypothetical protein